MKRQILLMLSAILSLAGCGMNSGNPDAPVSVAPHTQTWVTFHRNPTIEGFSADRSEALIECRVCHGVNLLGARGGAAGPACTDCHVVDPTAFPVHCYSCHGGNFPVPQDPDNQAVRPFDTWFANATSASQRLRSDKQPIDPAFVARVRTAGIHLKHDALSCAERNDPLRCRDCHGDSPELPNRHHSNKVFATKSCFDCHTFIFGAGFQVIVERNCQACHLDKFFPGTPGPCP